MKKLLVLASVAFFAACNSGTDTAKVESMGPGTDSSAQNVSYPYAITYSKFKIGDANHAKMLLEIWQDWDNGNLQTHKDYFADNMAMFIADAPPIMGTRDSVLATGQAFRDGYSSVKSTVDAVVPLYSVDSSNNWVAVWGKEVHTDKKGKTDSAYLQEVWRLNKDNKFDLMYQFNSVPPPPPPAPKK
jgi:hypothetical protein